MDILRKVKLSELKLKDSFFDSLRTDYGEIDFNNWFNKKAKDNYEAYVKFDDFNNLKVFLMLQVKDDVEEDIEPLQSPKKRIKISTLKIDDSIKSQRLSEAVISIIFNEMIINNVEESYVTLFSEKQNLLNEVLLSWGFEKTGKKGGEDVLTKSKNNFTNNLKKNYMWYLEQDFNNNYKKSNFYLLPFEEHYHDKMLPKNKLKNTENKSKDFNVSSISISKTYICKIDYKTLPKKGDFVLEYRMSSAEPKAHKSVVTGLGVIFEVFDERFENDFEVWCKKIGNTSVFSDQDLKEQFKKGRKIIIKFYHIFAFGEGRNINYNFLKDQKIIGDVYPMNMPLKNRELITQLIKERWK